MALSELLPVFMVEAIYHLDADTGCLAGKPMLPEKDWCALKFLLI